MYRSIWKAFFVLFFKPCLSTYFCLFKYSYCFYLILSHLTYKRKQMRMQTEIIISLMYSLILRETLLCWLWMPWLRNSTLQNRHTLPANVCLVCLFVCVLEGKRKKVRNKGRKKCKPKGFFVHIYVKWSLAFIKICKSLCFLAFSFFFFFLKSGSNLIFMLAVNLKYMCTSRKAGLVDRELNYSWSQRAPPCSLCTAFG